MSEEARFKDYVLEQVFSEIHNVSARAMFGGYGIYQEGVIFAIIAESKLYMKVGDSNRTLYEKLGSGPFVYQMPGGKPYPMSYWELPAAIVKDKKKLAEWVQLSVQETLSKAKPKRKLSNPKK